MYEILMVVYLVVAITLVGFILIQQGKGAGMGSAFGSGASGTVFGASGSGNFLTKTTTILAIVFFGVALGLGNITSDKTTTKEENSLFTGAEKVQNTDLPKVKETELPTETQGDLPVNAAPVEGDIPAVEDAKESEKASDKTDDDTKETDS
jgi:preprotein translocase subunit SecG